jgi:hypothetical protein
MFLHIYHLSNARHSNTVISDHAIKCIIDRSIDRVDVVRRHRTATPTGLLFIPPGDSLESHGDDGSWGKLLTRSPELSGNPTSRDIWDRVGGMDEGVRIFHISIFDTSTDL